MIGGIRNVLTVDEKLTANLQRRRQLAVCSRCLEPQMSDVDNYSANCHNSSINSESTRGAQTSAKVCAPLHCSWNRYAFAKANLVQVVSRLNY